MSDRAPIKQSFSTSGNGRELFRGGRYIRSGCGRGDPIWTILLASISSMDETHVCALDCEGVIVHESKTASTAEAIAAGQRIRVNDARLPSTWPGSLGPIRRFVGAA